MVIVLISLSSCNKSKDGTCNVLDYGARGDSVTMNTSSLQAVIDRCSADGGGRVVFPPGKYLTGSLLLKDDVELHVMKGATIYGSADSADYLHRIVDKESFTRDGQSHPSFFGLIMADGADNIAVTGSGVIDGNGAHSEDFKCYPLSDEPNSPWHKPDRPKLFFFYNCKNVKIHDITAINPNNWTMHYKRCDFLDIRGVRVYAHANANNDGINLDECQDVTINNSFIDTDDDALVFKSLGTRASKNITVTNSIISSKITPIKTGTESGGGFQNITISNCVIRPSYEEEPYDPHRSTLHGAGIALEIVDGGIMDGVVISNIVIEGSYAPFFLRLGNRGRKYGGMEPEPGQMKNIILENVICRNVHNDFSSTIAGFPGHYIENLTMSNIRIECEGGIQTKKLNPMPENEKAYPWPGMYGNDMPYPAYGIFFRHVKNLNVDNLQIIYEKEDSRPALFMDDVVDSRVLNLDFMSAGNPVKIVNSTNVVIED